MVSKPLEVLPKGLEILKTQFKAKKDALQAQLAKKSQSHHKMNNGLTMMPI
jgi:hypothetical protein